jgi:hypothetical protein
MNQAEHDTFAAINDSATDQLWMQLEEHLDKIEELSGVLEHSDSDDMKLVRACLMMVSQVVHRRRADRTRMFAQSERPES